MVVAAARAGVDKSVVDRVVEAADGVPLFVEEMLKMMGSAEGPEPVETDEIIVRRPCARSGSQSASIAPAPAPRHRRGGRRRNQTLAPISSTAWQASEARTSTPSSRPWSRKVVCGPASMWRAQATSSVTRYFSSAYDSILRKRRKQLHRQVADVLVERFPARADREPEVVAHHYTPAAASTPSRSPTGITPASRSLERAAFVEAARHFGHGIEALDAVGAVADDGLRPSSKATSGVAPSWMRLRAPGVDERVRSSADGLHASEA